ncbi:hypothetical protein KY336_02225, partial [Candidatus Woesearchaeota archaeon]|nr:hypothetical protein [Candidatus Woesearchaeota archaeon]
MKKILLFCIVLLLLISILGCVPKQKNDAVIINTITGDSKSADEFYGMEAVTGEAVVEAAETEEVQEEIVEETIEEPEVEEEIVEEESEPIQQPQPSTNPRVADHYDRMRRYAGLIDLNILTTDNCDETRVQWQQKLEEEEENLLDMQ